MVSKAIQLYLRVINSHIPFYLPVTNIGLHSLLYTYFKIYSVTLRSKTKPWWACYRLYPQIYIVHMNNTSRVCNFPNRAPQGFILPSTVFNQKLHNYYTPLWNVCTALYKDNITPLSSCLPVYRHCYISLHKSHRNWDKKRATDLK